MSNLIIDYRPKMFDEVIGQDKVKDSIINYSNELLSQREGKKQPLLLVGPSGVGKTTFGRLFAKYINCDNPTTNTVCKCNNCISIDAIDESNNQNSDYYELDATTNGGKSDIETIVSHTNYLPARNFKVILIDEAHTLTNAANNVLLHQLENPPERVVYILATTEENKIIETIRGRSILLRLNRIDNELIRKHLYDILSIMANDNPLEVVSVLIKSDDVLDFIVSECNGSVRNALTMLRSTLNLSDVTLGSVQESIGFSNYTDVVKLLVSLIEDDELGNSLVKLNKLKGLGINPKLLLNQFKIITNDLLNVKAGCKLTSVFEPNYYLNLFPNSNLEAVNLMLGLIIKSESLTYTIDYQLLSYTLAKVSIKLDNLKQLVELVRNEKRHAWGDNKKNSVVSTGIKPANTKEFIKAFNTSLTPIIEDSGAF